MGISGLISSSSLFHGGFVGGSISGATGGFAGGFIGGVGNSLFYGGNIGQSLKNGMIGGGSGMIIGGLLGGMGGGLSAIMHYGNFWNGDGSIYESLATTDVVSGIGEGMEYRMFMQKIFRFVFWKRC